MAADPHQHHMSFAYYQQLASLQEYVLVNTQRQAIEVYTREGDTWRYRLYGIGQTVTLHSMNASFALATVYEHVQVDQS